MHSVLIGLGSNREQTLNMKQAANYLRSYFPNIKFSSMVETEPYGDAYKTPFLNALAYTETDMNIEELRALLKSIEKNMGRLPSDKSEGKIIIDIDLIKWNDRVLKPKDLQLDFIKKLLLEIQNVAK